MKVNSLVDEAIIEALYAAAQAGVSIDIWVRGICCLRPGVSGLSENIRVRSVLGRFLEHSRIFAFDGGGQPEYWIGSADLMHRNLDRRVEAAVQLTRPEHHKEIDELFALTFDEGSATWHLGPDGEWTRVHRGEDGTPLRDPQRTLIEWRQRSRIATAERTS